MHKPFIAILLAMLCSCATPSKDPNKKDEPTKDNSPLLTKPVVRRIWIPDQILDGGKVFDQGHWRYLLEKETTWSK